MNPFSHLTHRDRGTEQYNRQQLFNSASTRGIKHKEGRQESLQTLFGPFWLCSAGPTAPLILNSKCRHLKLKSFIHWSDCETRRWFEVLTVTSQTAVSDYRAARKSGCFQSVIPQLILFFHLFFSHSFSHTSTHKHVYLPIWTVPHVNSTSCLNDHALQIIHPCPEIRTTEVCLTLANGHGSNKLPRVSFGNVKQTAAPCVRVVGFVDPSGAEKN